MPIVARTRYDEKLSLIGLIKDGLAVGEQGTNAELLFISRVANNNKT